MAESTGKQGKGLLPGPEIRGRVGYYGPPHLARLRLIGGLAIGESRDQMFETTAWVAVTETASLPREAEVELEVMGKRMKARLGDLRPVKTKDSKTEDGRKGAVHVNVSLAERSGASTSEINVIGSTVDEPDTEILPESSSSPAAAEPPPSSPPCRLTPRRPWPSARPPRAAGAAPRR